MYTRPWLTSRAVLFPQSRGRLVDKQCHHNPPLRPLPLRRLHLRLRHAVGVFQRAEFAVDGPPWDAVDRDHDLARDNLHVPSLAAIASARSLAFARCLARSLL